MDLPVHLPAAGRMTVPWKNGKGLTTDIATYPRDAIQDGWDWRISMATVDRAGPFSRFEGVDRVLLLLSGALRLRLSDDDAAIDLVAGAVIRFAGDTPAFGDPLGDGGRSEHPVPPRALACRDRSIDAGHGPGRCVVNGYRDPVFRRRGQRRCRGAPNAMLPHDALMIGQAGGKTADVVSAYPAYLIGISAA